MKGTCFLVKSGYWQQSLFLFAVFLSLQMSGCQGNSYTNNLLDAKNRTTTTSPETTNHSFSRYHSDTLPEDCFFCGDGEKTFPFLYQGQKNLGIINLNTLELSPIIINQYDDFGKQIEEAVSNAMNLLEGAYSLVLISSTKMIAARDPYGFRPLCYGKMADGAYVAASESCALSAVGAEFIRDVLPGEILVFTKNGVESRREHCGKQRKRTCIFEYIYFARPDSVIDGISVHESRMKAGELLAESYPQCADIVIGVPDSGLDAALGYAGKSGIPYGIGLIKNKYIGRTFISPGQNERLDKVRIKLSPVKKVIDGKRVVLIDDSIVRGTTSKRIVKLLRDAGAKEIHMRISAPPFLFPCYYGTDIDSEENLIACHHSVDEIAQMIGADSLGYLPIEKLNKLIVSEEYCAACFQGNYPTKIPADLRKDRFERKLSERV